MAHSPPFGRLPPIGRRVLAGGLAGLAAVPARAAARSRYVFNQDRGRLAFMARHLGVLSSTGYFDDFSAELQIDPNQPLTSAVTVTVRTAAVEIAYPGAVDLLRSPEFFDVAAYPEAHFSGAATGQGSLEHFVLAGNLTIRGITQPFVMQARLIGRRHDATLNADVADFSAAGDLKRSAYGMTSDTAAISDTIGLSVRVSLIV